MLVAKPGQVLLATTEFLHRFLSPKWPCFRHNNGW